MINIETLLWTIIGGITGSLLTYLGAIKISDRERKIKNFNDNAQVLRNALIKTQQRLTTIKRDWSTNRDINDIIKDIVKDDFLIHDEMARRFSLCITDKNSGFTEAWDNYQYWYYNVACQGTTDRLFSEQNPFKDEPMFKQALKDNPAELIKKIIENTKHK